MLAQLHRYFDLARAQISELPPPETLDAFLNGLTHSIPEGQTDVTQMVFDVLGPGCRDRRVL